MYNSDLKYNKITLEFLTAAKRKFRTTFIVQHYLLLQLEIILRFQHPPLPPKVKKFLGSCGKFSGLGSFLLFQMGLRYIYQLVAFLCSVNFVHTDTRNISCFTEGCIGCLYCMYTRHPSSLILQLRVSLGIACCRVALK